MICAVREHQLQAGSSCAGGQVTPVIDRHYPFEELAAAVAYQEAGHAPGKVVVTV